MALKFNNPKGPPQQQLTIETFDEFIFPRNDHPLDSSFFAIVVQTKLSR
jgi:hypothetical protein